MKRSSPPPSRPIISPIFFTRGGHLRGDRLFFNAHPNAMHPKDEYSRQALCIFPVFAPSNLHDVVRTSLDHRTLIPDPFPKTSCCLPTWRTKFSKTSPLVRLPFPLPLSTLHHSTLPPHIDFQRAYSLDSLQYETHYFPAFTIYSRLFSRCVSRM
jgi:hypothetical protein